MCTEQREGERCDGSVISASVVTQLQKINEKTSEKEYKDLLESRNVIIFSRPHTSDSDLSEAWHQKLGHSWASPDSRGWVWAAPSSLTESLPHYNCSELELLKLIS